ncbi:MAG: indole-3-glycerol phosphate synthase TrpC [Planctomycetes bacterium]|nr:indole-3-glycerol phosphate synthase TrpC [Planctomycetota bacterium]
MILDEIIAYKRSQILPTLPNVDRAALRDLLPCRGFRAALKRASDERITVIAESKKGSPSKGIFTEDYDPVLNAMNYVMGGAQCMSVLTDEKYFYGHLDHLVQVRAAIDLPLIRKDFLVDERQIAEARLYGADAILLIVACLELGQLVDLKGFAHDIGLDVLVEVHNADEAAIAVQAESNMIGVNNRNLQTFAVDLEHTFELLPGIAAQDRVIVSESGISERDQCRRLEEAGVDAILVGETFMRADDPATAIKLLRGDLF